MCNGLSGWTREMRNCIQILETQHTIVGALRIMISFSPYFPAQKSYTLRQLTCGFQAVQHQTKFALQWRLRH